MINAILIRVFSFLFIFSEILPQTHISFNHLTVEDGLSQNSVYCIFQDSKGFMWFGTQGGLNRYDGYNIKVFKNIPDDSTSLKDNFIFSIYEDPFATIYIETQSGAFHRYNPRSESFQILNKDSIDLKKAKVSSILAQLQEDSGIKWMGGLGQGTGLERFNTKTGEKTIFKHNPNDPSSISDDKVYSVYRDRLGNLWVGTSNGLDRLDELTGKFFHYRNNPSDPFSISDNWVWPIFEDSRGNLWIGTNKGGLCFFDPTSGRFYNYKNDPND
ncbi:MAG: two-component regulator propeller domain-containing protein, partial [Ignavibacteriaceae bacterium]